MLGNFFFHVVTLCINLSGPICIHELFYILQFGEKETNFVG